VNQKVIARLLEKAGFVVDLVVTGAEAVEAVTRVHYDLVLMDCHMPGMDGFEATAAIRAAELGTARHVPIIALTASVMEADRDRCQAAGMDDFLGKPIKADALARVLERWTIRPLGEGPGSGPPGVSAPATMVEDPRPEIHAGAAPLDLAHALRYIGGDAELLGELLRQFAADCPERLRELRDTIAGGDSEALMRAAHSLHGALGAIGARAAAALASALEAGSRQGRTDGTGDLLTRLERELDRINRFVEELGRAGARPTI